MGTTKYVSPSKFLRSVVKHDDEFLGLLVEELMLDELLCGEVNPKEFFLQCFDKVLKDQAFARMERRKAFIQDKGFIRR